MRFSICLIPAFILLLSAAGCNCCYQPGYYDPNGLAYAPALQPPAFKPLPRPTWLGNRNRKHDPATCPLCSSHASSAPHAVPLSVPHEGEVIHENGAVSHTHDPEGFHQHYQDQPVQLNGIVPTSHSQIGGSYVEQAAYRDPYKPGSKKSAGCGCGNPGCQSGCNGQCGYNGSHNTTGHCGADRSRDRAGCGAHSSGHQPGCSGSSRNCGCGVPHSCGCGAVPNCGPCVTCDVVEGFPMSETVIDSGCSTCGTTFNGGSYAMGGVIPGTIMNGEMISGGMIPGEVIGDGVIFDGSIVNGGTFSGDSHEVGKPCPNCGKHHSTTVQPVPESQSHEEIPGQINQGTLKPHTTPAQTYDGTSEPGAGGEDVSTDNQSVPAAQEPSATHEPEALPGATESPRAIPQSLPATHPPAGAARAKTTPSSWRTSGPRTSPFRNAGSEEFQEPVREPQRLEPTTLMIPTIPDKNDTRHVHWVPAEPRN